LHCSGGIIKGEERGKGRREGGGEGGGEEREKRARNFISIIVASPLQLKNPS
jgi:hypothetical protein